MILALDFDGVIASAVRKPGHRMPEPAEGAIEGMRWLKGQGHTLIVHTVRGDRPKHVEDWLHHFGIPYDRVTNLKPDADCYIDDNALHFTRWNTLCADAYETLGLVL